MREKNLAIRALAAALHSRPHLGGRPLHFQETVQYRQVGLHLRAVYAFGAQTQNVLRRLVGQRNGSLAIENQNRCWASSRNCTWRSRSSVFWAIRRRFRFNSDTK